MDDTGTGRTEHTFDVYGIRYTCYPKFPDPHEFPISVERPFSVKHSAEMTSVSRFLAGKSAKELFHLCNHPASKNLCYRVHDNTLELS